MPKLRIAVIGVGANRGSRARQYLETITRLSEHYELAAICDRNPTVGQEVATQYGIQARYENVTALFDAEKLDVILSLAPKDSHIVIALTAARRTHHHRNTSGVDTTLRRGNCRNVPIKGSAVGGRRAGLALARRASQETGY